MEWITWHDLRTNPLWKALCSSKFKTLSRIFPSNIPCPTQVALTQIRIGFSNFNHDFYSKGCTDIQSCDCGHIIDDFRLFCLICTLYINPSRDMLSEDERHSQVRITPQLLLLKWKSSNEAESMHKNTAVCKFIITSKCFRWQVFQLFIKLIWSNVL